MQLFRLDGKVAVVTGASRGIGRAIAERLAEHGARVVVSSRKLEACQQVVDGIAARGGAAIARVCHIGRKDDLQSLVSETESQWGGIDILVCNAAVNPYFGPAAGMTDEAFDRVMATNVRSTFWLTNLALPGMAARGHAGECQVGEPEGAANVGGHHPVKGLVGHAGRRPEVGIDRGIAHQDVDAAPLRLGLAHQALQIVLAPDVANAGDRRPAARRNAVDHLLTGLELAARYHDARAVFGKALGNGATNATACAGDHGHLAVQTKELHRRSRKKSQAYAQSARGLAIVMQRRFALSSRPVSARGATGWKRYRQDCEHGWPSRAAGPRAWCSRSNWADVAWTAC